MNDELIERLAELLNQGRLTTRDDLYEIYPHESAAALDRIAEKEVVKQAQAMLALIKRVRFVIGASSDTNDEMLKVLIRKALS